MDDFKDTLKNYANNAISVVIMLLLAAIFYGLWRLIGGSVQTFKDFGPLIAILCIISGIVAAMFIARRIGLDDRPLPQGRMRWYGIIGAIAAIALATFVSTENHASTQGDARRAREQAAEAAEQQRLRNSPAMKAAADNAAAMQAMKDRLDRRRATRPTN